MNAVLTYQQFAYSLILVLLAAATALFAVSRWRLRQTLPTANFVAWMLWCAALWILANAFEVISANVPTALFWNKLQYLAVSPIPVLWFGLAQQFTGVEHQRIRRRMLLAAIVPAVCLIVLVTNDYHGLYIAAARLVYPNSVAYLDTDSGPVMIVEYVYEYLLTSLGIYILSRKLFHSGEYRRQASIILLGVALTLSANILDWSHLNPIPQIRLTPWALALSVPLFVSTLIRSRRADIVPIARSNVIQIMQDAVLVLDVENRVIDLNPAAENIIGRSLAQVFGKPIDLEWSEWATHVDVLLQKPEGGNEIRLGEGKQQRVFDVRRSELDDWRGERISRVVVLRDITKRAQAEEALQMSEEYFRALSENATDSVVIINAEATISYASPSIERVFGYNISEIMGKSTQDFIHPDDVGAVLTALAASIEHPGIATPVIARFGTAEDWRRVECTINNLLDHPFVKGIVVNARDITERAEAEERLRLSEEYFRALTENSTDVTIITNKEGVIQYVSPSLERIFGRTREEIVGKNALEFIHRDDVNRLSASQFEAMLKQESVGMATVRFHDQGGGWHILECRARSMLDHATVKGIVVNARDVTEREAVAEALRQSEERYRLHFTNVSDVIYSYDTRRIVQTMSPSVTRHLGITPEEAIGKSVVELDVLPPEYLEKAAAEAERVLAGERIEGSVYELVGRDGTRKIAEISSSPIYQDNTVIAAVNVARDITERVRVEERLRASLAEKEILLKEIHHRVKNNLQIIVSLLSLQSSSTDNPLAIAQFRDSQNRVRSMALIHERLYRSQDLAQIDFGTYLRDLAGYLLQSYKEQSAEVNLTVETDDIHLDIDTAIPCGLLVVEMVSNALKHAFPGGRRGAIGVDMRFINNTSYRLSVCDDGVGFPAHVDYRDTTSLGLQLVNSLTHQLGGTVEVQAVPGTTFTICFPKPTAHSHPSIQVENSK